MRDRASWLFTISLLSAGCAVAPDATESREDVDAREQKEEWSSADDPALFTQSLERNIERLPIQGEASESPWPGSYWRMSQDSINYRWDGPASLSPTERYERAFGGHGKEDRVSRYFGIDSQSSAKACTKDSECDASLSEVCGKRTGAFAGRCIPTWYGICHGWAPAAILFPEPKHAVVENGVTFKVQDIKALLSLVHDKVSARSISLRCEAREGGAGGSAAEYDASGRPVKQDCRDTNPGTFHIILANYLGIQKKSFVEDRTFDYQVWNQPIRGYKVLEARAVSAPEANSLIGAQPTGGGGGGRYRFNDDAASLMYVKNKIAYIVEATSETDGHLSDRIDAFTLYDVYEYILELDRRGKIIGGEWVGGSKRKHPDFLWLPTGPGATSVAGGAIRYDLVKKLADASVAP